MKANKETTYIPGPKQESEASNCTVKTTRKWKPVQPNSALEEYQFWSIVPGPWRNQELL